MGKFENKVVIITGAGRGAGKKPAICFYEEGAVVGLLDLSDQNLDAAVGEVNPDTGRFLTHAVDISGNRQMTSAIDNIGKRFGRIDMLINNVGVLHKGMTESPTDMHMKFMVDINLMGSMYCTHASVSYMKENDGNIINVSPIPAASPNTGSGAYGAVKASMIVLTKVWAAELAPYKIRVNCYVPGVLNTPMAEGVIKNRTESKLCQIPPHRFGEAGGASDLVSLFCSGQASYITGQTIGLDGGIWITQTPTAAWKL